MFWCELESESLSLYRFLLDQNTEHAALHESGEFRFPLVLRCTNDDLEKPRKRVEHSFSPNLFALVHSRVLIAFVWVAQAMTSEWHIIGDEKIGRPQKRTEYICPSKESHF